MLPTLGIYIHIPFCESKCHYCNFASGVYPDSMVLPYLAALREEILGVRSLLAEMGASPAALHRLEVDTVYFGGGTPSLIEASHIAGLMGLLGEIFSLSADREVTLEVNPGSADLLKARQHQTAGINRASIGMQTFQDELLERIGRSHTLSESLATLSHYREAGISNISVDLIAGLPGQTEEHWQHNLDQVEDLSPEHISMYMLEIHENTRFGRIYGQGAGAKAKPDGSGLADLPDEEQVTEFYRQAVQRFGQLGYRQYEISNFARPGRESRHNLKYWTDQPFLGFGCGAYSYFDGKRWGNERSAGRYIDLIHQRQQAIDFRTDLSPIERQEEAIFLGLRLADGVLLPDFERKFGFDLRDRYREQIAFLQDAGLVELTQESLRLTHQGQMLSNEVFAELLR